MCDCLKFSVTYSRRVQPRDYEHVTYGINEEFPKTEVTHDEAFDLLETSVEKRIDRKLQEIYARENDKR